MWQARGQQLPHRACQPLPTPCQRSPGSGGGLGVTSAREVCQPPGYSEGSKASCCRTDPWERKAVSSQIWRRVPAVTRGARVQVTAGSNPCLSVTGRTGLVPPKSPWDGGPHTEGRSPRPSGGGGPPRPRRPCGYSQGPSAPRCHGVRSEESSGGLRLHIRCPRHWETLLDRGSHLSCDL